MYIRYILVARFMAESTCVHVSPVVQTHGLGFDSPILHKWCETKGVDYNGQRGALKYTVRNTQYAWACNNVYF